MLRFCGYLVFKIPGIFLSCFEDLESGFTEIIEAEKEGRKPYLP